MKYLNTEHTLVTDGNGWSGSTESPEYLTWLAKSNTVEPSDPAPVPTYQELRAAEYPPMSNYLDGLVKGDKVQMQAYIDACLAVKAKYPKP